MVYQINHFQHFNWTSLVVQRLKRLPAMWETWVQSLGWEDPLEKEMATHSSILAWRMPWTEELGGQVAKSPTRLSDFTFTFTIKRSEIENNRKLQPSPFQKQHSNFQKHPAFLIPHSLHAGLCLCLSDDVGPGCRRRSRSISGFIGHRNQDSKFSVPGTGEPGGLPSMESHRVRHD